MILNDGCLMKKTQKGKHFTKQNKKLSKTFLAQNSVSYRWNDEMKES